MYNKISCVIFFISICACNTVISSDNFLYDIERVFENEIQSISTVMIYSLEDINDQITITCFKLKNRTVLASKMLEEIDYMRITRMDEYSYNKLKSKTRSAFEIYCHTYSTCSMDINYLTRHKIYFYSSFTKEHKLKRRFKHMPIWLFSTENNAYIGYMQECL